MIEVYRGWRIDADYIGYSAVSPNYDAWTDNGEWVSNGQSAWGRTVQEVKDEIDTWIEENPDMH